MLKSRIISLCCLWILQFRICIGFNLDFEFPVLKQGPSGSLFGFSVAEHQFTKAGGGGLNHRILVGAPNGTNKFQQKLTTPGTVFACDATSISTNCEDEVPFDRLGNSDSGTEDKSKQWFGVSLKSSGIDKPVLACAHRYLFKTSGKNFHLYEGACHTATGALKNGDLYTPCNLLNGKLAESATVPSYENSGQCLSGIGTDIVEIGKERSYFVGSVGYFYFQGAVFQMPQQEDEGFAENIKSDVNSTAFQIGLMGYSMDHGTFLDKKRIDFASGAPRSDSIGMVIVLSKQKVVNGTGFSLKMRQSLPAATEQVQIGSSFGFAIRAVDSDNDGYTELLVGAPFHAEDNHPGQGMVYYYRNNGKGKLVLKAKFTAKGVRSNFGASIANAGDIDLDGFSDVVIGAPYEDGGKGAIYLYRGSSKGLKESVAQKISASSVNSGLMGFGRAVAGGLDLDGNGYKDVLVGAYASDSAVLLRARPVIDVETSIEFRQPYVDTTVKDFKVRGKDTTLVQFRLCTKYKEISGNVAGSQMVTFKVVADPGMTPRLKFTTTDKSTTEINTPVTLSRKCKVLKAYLVYNEVGTISVYPDITLLVTHKLLPDSMRKPTPTPGKVTSLDGYAVLALSDSTKDGHVLKTAIEFKRDCRPCVPDIVIETEKNQTIRLGTATYPFNVTVKNKGPDPAYAVSIALTLPAGITLSDVQVGKRQIQCQEPETNEDNTTVTVCNNLYFELQKGKVSVVSLILDTKNLSPFSTKNDVTVNVTSANPEKATDSDNVVTTPLTIKANADLALQGSFRTRQEFYGGVIKGESAIRRDDEIGHVVRHRYYVFNLGPDRLPSAIVTIHWPSLAVSGKHLFYLTVVETENAKCHLKPKQVNELGYVITSVNNTVTARSQKAEKRRLRREAETTPVDPKSESKKTSEEKTDSKKEKTTETGSESKPGAIGDSGSPPAGSAARGEKGGKEGKILDCRKKTAKCTPIVCEVTKFEKGGSAFITLTARIWNSTFLMDYHGDVVTIVSYANVRVGSNVSYIKDDDMSNNAAELFTVVRPDFPSKGAEAIAVWKIALAILAGVILLALLIFGLYKVGFFNRRRGSPIRKKKEIDGADDSLLGSKKK